jgi:hypothetical protein
MKRVAGTLSGDGANSRAEVNAAPTLVRRLDVIAIQEKERDDQVAEDADADHEHGKEGVFGDSSPCHEISLACRCDAP